MLAPVITEGDIRKLLAVVRLGDADRLGWWRSHSVTETAEYVLGEALPTTWLATGVELGVESARLRQEALLGRPSAVHLFSDYLPYHRFLRAWLIERKLERDSEPLEWLRTAEVEDLRAVLAPAAEGDRRGGGIYLGSVGGDALAAPPPPGILARLTGAYAQQDRDLAAPYLDLTV